MNEINTATYEQGVLDGIRMVIRLQNEALKLMVEKSVGDQVDVKLLFASLAESSADLCKEVKEKIIKKEE